MNVIVHSKTMVITEALRSFATRQAQRLKNRGQRIANVIVFLEFIQRKKNDARAATAKFLIDLPGKNIVVQERAKDLYFAIHRAALSANRQVRKVKERRMYRLARAETS